MDFWRIISFSYIMLSKVANNLWHFHYYFWFACLRWSTLQHNYYVLPPSTLDTNYTNEVLPQHQRCKMSRTMLNSTNKFGALFFVGIKSWWWNVLRMFTRINSHELRDCRNRKNGTHKIKVCVYAQQSHSHTYTTVQYNVTWKCCRALYGLSCNQIRF